MQHKKILENGIVHIAILIAILLISIIAIVLISFKNSNNNQQIAKQQISKLIPFFPSPTPIAHYIRPLIKQSDAYTIIFVGDSMIDSLGDNFDNLRQDLEDYYPNTVFGLFNYGYGSTNILSLKERLNSETTYGDKTNEAILDRFLDIIIIGSFGHNPLSDLPLEKGLEIQTEVLDDIVLQLVTEKPNTLIVFLAEFAPSENNYAKGVVDLNPQQRSIWVNERKAYIKNHIDYANRHNIPLINVYEKSLVNEDVNLDYISKDDYIHPSSTGLIFMSKTIADFLYNNDILP
jgi:lysophospholipase L1-like esterase